jgi:hypothetical protein
MARNQYRPRYADGHEWRNERGQWFVQRSAHPHGRADGMVARAKLVIEALMEAMDGLPEGFSKDDYAVGRTGFLDPKERVWHRDGDPANDDPENLMLFPTQADLVRHISAIKHAAVLQQDRETMDRYQERIRVLKEQRMAAAHKGAAAAAQARIDRKKAPK